MSQHFSWGLQLMIINPSIRDIIGVDNLVPRFPSKADKLDSNPALAGSIPVETTLNNLTWVFKLPIVNRQLENKNE